MTQPEYRYRRRYVGGIRAVIFDWAGTIVDYGSRAPAGVFVEVFRRQGVSISMDEARGPMGTYKRDHLRILTEMPSVRQRWRAAHGRDPLEADIDAMFEAFIPLQLECLPDYGDVIPGAIEIQAWLRDRGIRIGSSTGYNREMTEIVTAGAARQGLEPDACVCNEDVGEGRPAPWMCFENLKRLGVYPVESAVKVDDTLPGIEAGLAAGMWTVGVIRTGNELGLSAEEVAALPADELENRLRQGRERFLRAGAHAVVDAVGDLAAVIEGFEQRLTRGEKP